MVKKLFWVVLPLLFISLISWAEDPAEDFVDTEFSGTAASSDLTDGDSLIGELETTNPSDIPVEPFDSPTATVEPNGLGEEDFATTTQSSGTAAQSGGDVVLEQVTDLNLPYKDRRGRHGVLFSLMYEQFYPLDYYSLYNDGYIEDIIGEDRIPLMGAELGYKFNFALGSIGILASYARGYAEKETVTGERSLDIARTAVSANFALDNFLKEPWIVPYAQVGMHQFSIVEDNLSQDKAMSDITSWSLNYRFGLLFQLNWIESAIDPNTHTDGLRSSGLQNTFLDVFMSEHVASSNVRDPLTLSEGDSDMTSSQELGVALKMEF